MQNSTQPGVLTARVSVRYGNKPPVLREAAFEIRRGEVLGLVGQSGSGKSTLAMTILGLLDRKSAKSEGEIDFEGTNLLTLRERELRSLRGRKIALVLQSPLSSLNPLMTVGRQIGEIIALHRGTPAPRFELN